MVSASTGEKIRTTAIAHIGHQEGSAWQRPLRPTRILQLQHSLQVKNNSVTGLPNLDPIF